MMEIIDFSLVEADDEYLDHLGSARPPILADGLSVELLAWRSTVDAVPIGELVSLPVAVSIVLAAIERRRGECA